MEAIIELSDITIYREKINKYVLEIQHNLDNNTDFLLSYLSNRLNQDFTDEFRKLNADSNHNTEIAINAYSIRGFKDYLEEKNYRLDYDIVLKILQELSKLITYLERTDKSIAVYSLDDLIVIDEETFLFVNNESIFSLNPENPKNIQISVPLEITKFASPELAQQSELPFSLDYRASFFSLASFLTYCLFAETLLGKTSSEVENILEPIYNTKLYWFILRCASLDIKKRVCIFI